VKKVRFISFMIVFFIAGSLPAYNPIACNMPPFIKSLLSKKPAQTVQVADAKELNPFTFDYELNAGNMDFFGDGDTITTLICTTPFYAGAHRLPSQKTYEYEDARDKKVAEICQEGAKIEQAVNRVKPRLTSMRDYYSAYLSAVLALEPSLQEFVTEALSKMSTSAAEEMYVEAEYKSFSTSDISNPYTKSTFDYIKAMKAMELGDLYLRDVENIMTGAGALLTTLEKHPNTDIQYVGDELDKNMKKLDPLKEDLFAIQASMEKMDYGLKQINTGEYYFALAANDFIMSSMPDLEARLAAMTPNEDLDQEDIDFIKTYLTTVKQWQTDMKEHIDAADKSQMIALEDLPEDICEGISPVYARGDRSDYSSAYKSVAAPAKSTSSQDAPGYLSTGWEYVKSGFHSAQQAVGKVVTVGGEVWGTGTYGIYRVWQGKAYGNSAKEIWNDIKDRVKDGVSNVANGTGSMKAPEIYKGAGEILEGAESAAGQAADTGTQIAVQTVIQKITGSKEGGDLGGWPGWVVGGLVKNTVGLFTGLGKGICKVANPESSKGDYATGALDIIAAFTGGSKTIIKGTEIPAVSKGAAEGGAILTKMGANFLEKMGLKFPQLGPAGMSQLQKTADKYEKGVMESLINGLTKQNDALKNEFKELMKKGGTELGKNFKKTVGEAWDDMWSNFTRDLPGIKQAIGKVLGPSPKDYLDNVFGNMLDDFIKDKAKSHFDGNPPKGVAPVVPAKSTTTTASTKSDSSPSGSAKQNVSRVGTVTLELTYPAGQSPRVFTRGWVFGAKAIVNPGKSSQKDISDQVRWSGSGTFDPDTGKVSHPTFKGEGSNKIVLTVTVGENKTVTKEFSVQAVSPDKYARVGWIALCPADTHGCPGDPKTVLGPITKGSPTVSIDGAAAARVGDPGIHRGCCGPNTFVIDQGDPTVLIDGKPAAQLGDRTKHCGGMGSIIGPGFSILLTGGQVTGGSGTCFLESDNPSEFGTTLLQPIFSKLDIPIEGNAVNVDESIPVEISSEGSSASGTAKVKMKGMVDKGVLSGTYSVDALFNVQWGDDVFPIDIRYAGTFKSTPIPSNPSGGNVELTYTGPIKSKAFIQMIYAIMQGVGGALSCGKGGAGSTTTQLPPPDSDTLCDSYSARVQYTLETPKTLSEK